MKVIKKINDLKYKFNLFLDEQETNIVLNYAIKTEGNIIEIGCNSGLTSLAMANSCPEKTIYSVDYVIATNINQEYEIKDLWEYCKDINNIVCINANSNTMDLKQFKNVSMAFIDGDHTHNSVKKDYENIIQLINKGVIIFHDYNPDSQYEWNGVAKFIDELSITNDVIIIENTMLAVIEI